MEKQEQNSICREIGARTGGDIYIGVVGPVRSGKSTFIKRFMEQLVLPAMSGSAAARERARDELPQSAAGRTIMTTEPKFIPETAVPLQLEGGGACRVRLIDCVGYMVEGAMGHEEDAKPRMVKSPWFEQEVPFDLAAETGTRKVICEHSTIGVVVTTDGSVSDIPRAGYAEAERRVVTELEALGKPYIILLNSTHPDAPETRQLAEGMARDYRRTVLPVSCVDLDAAMLGEILRRVLYEFPVCEIGFVLPRYIGTLPLHHPVQNSIYQCIRTAAANGEKMRDVQKLCRTLEENEYVERASVDNMALGRGSAVVRVDVPETVFYGIVGEQTGIQVRDDADLIRVLEDFAAVKQQYERLHGALDQVYQTGYGIVMPSVEELSLEEPEIVRQGGRYGVRLRASAPSIHMMRANIKAEVNPIVGTEKQSEELVHYLLSEFEEQPEKIWETNIFGKSLNELVREELSHKLSRMPDDARGKIRETLEKIINESAGGLICIIL